MSFFYNQIRKDPKPKSAPSVARRREIPIQSLRELGCSVCPLDKEAPRLTTPKMLPTGVKKPSVYLLGTGPNNDEDRLGEHWRGPAGEVILSMFSRGFVRQEMRFGHLTQCMPPLGADGARDLSIGIPEMECCRPRVISDIEESQPLIIVGVGDIPLRWATGLDNETSALTLRGRLLVVKIGRHVCWYYPILWPNFLNSKSYGKSEYELTLEHDCRWVESLIDDGELEPPAHHAAPYDLGIERITGEEPGDLQRLERALADLASLPENALDIETNGLQVHSIKRPLILTAAVGTFDRVVAFCIEHPDGWGSEGRQAKVLDLFGEYLLFSGTKTCHNLAFEMEWIAYKYGGKILRLTSWNDTMSMAHTIDARPGTKSLDVQCAINFGFRLKKQSPVDVNKPNWWTLYPLREILRYNGMDTKWTDLLRTTYEPVLDAQVPSQRHEHERKVRLAPTLVLMEAKGLPIDLDYAKKLEEEFDIKVERLAKRIQQCHEVKTYTTRFGTFSPGNPNHVLKLLKDVCSRSEVKVVDRDGSTSFTSGEEALATIPASEVPSAPLILEFRGVDKMRTTYLGPLVRGDMTGIDGRIHTKYGSMTAITGRLAAQDPAVQNWPIRKFKEIRGSVVAEPGGWILAADVGAGEARCFAMASGDEKLIRYMWTKYDIHSHWATRIEQLYPEVKDWVVREFALDWDEKGHKTLRQEMKNKWVFPQFFGASVRTCAAELHVPEDIMQNLADEFWIDEFSGVKRWQKKLQAFYQENLYVETLTGRRRRGPMSLNELLNHPIQGTLFDIVGAGMDALSERAMEEDKDYLQQALQVHDDNSFWVPDAHLEETMGIVAREMCKHRFDWINVPIVVEMKVGTRWSELQEVAEYRSDELFNIRNPYK